MLYRLLCHFPCTLCPIIYLHMCFLCGWFVRNRLLWFHPCRSRRRLPTNGDECFYWRTTGCDYGDKCRFKHIPNQQGRDKKPWQSCTLPSRPQHQGALSEDLQREKGQKEEWRMNADSWICVCERVRCNVNVMYVIRSGVVPLTCWGNVQSPTSGGCIKNKSVWYWKNIYCKEVQWI